MAELTYPGVFRREIEQQARVTQGVTTANLALTGFFRKGPVSSPTLVQSFPEFERIFGSFNDRSIAPLAVRDFYANGGTNAYINRVVGSNAEKSVGNFITKTLDENLVTTSALPAPLPSNLAGSRIVPGTLRLFYTDVLLVNNELLGQTDGVATTQVFTTAFARLALTTFSLNFTDNGGTPVTLVSDPSGNLTGGGTATGTVNVNTGQISLTYGVDGTQAGSDVTLQYDYEPATFVPSERVSTAVLGQRFYFGTLSNRHVIQDSVLFTWTDASNNPNTATASDGVVLSNPVANSGETIATATGAESDIRGFTAQSSIQPGSLTVDFQDSSPAAVTLTDDGLGGLSGPGTAAGTVDYDTGQIDITFGVDGVNAGAITADYTGSDSPAGFINELTGEFSLNVSPNPPAAGGVIDVAYAYRNFIETTDDGAGVIPAGSVLTSDGTIDYDTGAITGEVVAVNTPGLVAPLYADYDVRIQDHQAKNEGVAGDDLRIEIIGESGSIDPATGNFGTYTVTILEENEGNGVFVQVDQFFGVVLDDLTSPRHISQVLNDPFRGSDLVEVVTPFSAVIPTSLQGKASSGVKIDLGDGSARETVATLPNAGGLVPSTLVVTYTSGGASQTITENGSGVLSGAVDPAQPALINYTTGLLRFTPQLAPDAGTDILVSFSEETASSTLNSDLVDGADGDPLLRTDVTDISNQTDASGIYAFDQVNELLLMALPDFAGDEVAEAALVAYADSREDSVAIISPPGGASVEQAVNYKQVVLALRSDRGAMYYPNLLVENPIDQRVISVPPIAHAIGVIARTDQARGVGKSPAGTNDGVLNSIIDFEGGVLTENQVATLFAAGINAMWQPPNQPRCVWGARTLDNNGEYRYLSNRRTMDFISVSIQRSLWWATFENNGPALRTRIASQVRAFLRIQYGNGLLSGNTESESFFVQSDSSNNNQATIDQGIVLVDYGVALFRPAEFIVLQHRQLAG